ncbi:uncharacterized protein LOC130738264 [Lotus japonicus]|uniref:uncharacterized protein LOC130738264 n=1 Tax=Lotus japonicus TaxID=34305 RepID=UPI00258C954E|nr:uncharacterized protein LOC130738264 [Lotus japonicus]
MFSGVKFIPRDQIRRRKRDLDGTSSNDDSGERSKRKSRSAETAVSNTRKDMGLAWMLRPESKRPAFFETELSEEVPIQVSKKVNPKELNPYLKDNDSGYPEESDGAKVGADKLLSSSLVGDRFQQKINGNRFLTQQERCLLCLENPNRPLHLIVSIANWTYLMLPQWQLVVPGHCCILPIHHESATRSVDDNVWVEIRNFKKSLITMFAKQGKEVVFLETLLGLAEQRRHCMIECIPLPQHIAKQAPLFFKKAIDEADDEWSQHNAKKLIDTSQKGLRNSIPEHFPYFHVEFGLNKGFVHVIDDEKLFKRSFGLNVIRGLLYQRMGTFRLDKTTS